MEANANGKGEFPMKPSYLPAVSAEFRPKDHDPAKPPVYLHRPYAVVPPADLLKMSEEPGAVGALLELGERHYFGTGAEQDYLKAYGYLLRAAEGGAQDAAYLIAECYRCGHGVRQDYDKYFDWLDRAAQQGSWMAMFNLTAAFRDGSAAYDGHGPAIDPEQCFAWSLEAEKTIRAYWEYYTQPGFVDFREIWSNLTNAYLRACAQLSSLYADGFGVTRDLKRALYWLERGKRFAVNAANDRSLPVFEKEIADIKARMEREKLRRTQDEPNE